MKRKICREPARLCPSVGQGDATGGLIPSLIMGYERPALRADFALGKIWVKNIMVIRNKYVVHWPRIE